MRPRGGLGWRTTDSAAEPRNSRYHYSENGVKAVFVDIRLRPDCPFNRVLPANRVFILQ